MKLGEMEFNGREGDFIDLGSILGQYRGSKVRVEIHSLDDPPWPTERPEGWGPGCWCRISSGQYGICTWLSGDDREPQVSVVILTDGQWSKGASVQGLLRDLVMSYGSRAEVQ